jgi:hypothetical protein
MRDAQCGNVCWPICPHRLALPLAASQKGTRHWRRVPVEGGNVGIITRFLAALCVVIGTRRGELLGPPVGEPDGLESKALKPPPLSSKRRRVVWTGSADVFVGGVLSTRSAGVMWRAILLARVRAGAEIRASPRLVVPRFMAKTRVVPKKKRGPAPTGKGVQVGERWHPSELAAIDAWIAASSDNTLTRAHAIRRLVALGLKVKGK